MPSSCRMLKNRTPICRSIQFEYCVNISLGHRYIYVTTPKCGCSTIQLSLQRLELANPNFDRADFEDLHVRKYSPLLNARQVGSFTQLLNNPSFVKFCFVRHPYSRLLSAYLDKIVRDKGPAKANVLTLLGGSDLNQEVSFEDFINVICEQPVIQMDDHWRVQYYQTMQPKDIL